MSDDEKPIHPSDPLLLELERLRETSRTAMSTFKAIEARLQELEKQIEKSRASAVPNSVVWRPKS
jgi:hypothetical protein